MRKSTLLGTGILLFLLLFTAPHRLFANPIFTDGFEHGLGSWRSYNRLGTLTYSIDSKHPQAGTAAAKIESQAVGNRGWLTTTIARLKPGKNYFISLWCRTEAVDGEARPRLKIRDRSGVQLPIVGNPFCDNNFGDINLPALEGSQGWQKIEGWFVAPLDAAQMTMELVLNGAGTVWWDEITVREVAELPLLPPGSLSVELMQPEAGAQIAVNPPAFIWSRAEGIAEYTIEVSSSPAFDNKLEREIKQGSIYVPNWTFAPGVWYWRIRADLPGGMLLYSNVSNFVVSQGLPYFPMPSLSELKAQIPKEHPRLFFLKNDLPQIRLAALGEGQQAWSKLEAILERDLGKTVLADPAPYKNGVWNAADWRRIWDDAQVARDTVQNYAFGYLMTGNPLYLAEAKKWLLAIAAWDPAGSTGDASNDEASRAILEGFGFAYDWLYDQLTPEERSLVLTSILARGVEMYHRVGNAVKLEINPYNSHDWNKAGILAQTAVAIWGDDPIAESWLTYSVSLLMGRWPAWGGADGGWAEGVFYHAPYINRFLRPAQALVRATGIDLLKHPWFDKGSYFQLYCWLPGTPGIEFGDSWPSLSINATAIANMEKLAAYKQNPYLKWYVEASGKENNLLQVPESFLPQREVLAKAPVDLPQANSFEDVGFAVMHRDLCDPLENAVLAFKSGPYGSLSHSHADQNSFNISAFGERLAIDSGYYDYAGSPHHNQWTRQTKAHNTILVNGAGQAARKAGTGSITGFLTSNYYDYVSGEAGAAYEGRLDNFTRQIIYLRPDFYLIADDLKGPTRASYDWLLHALSEMQIDEVKREIKINQGESSLDVKFLEPSKLTFTQNDKFTQAPEGTKPNQWHLAATARATDDKQRFLVLLHPGKTTKPVDYVVEKLAGIDFLGVKLAQDNQINYLGFSFTTEAEVAGIKTDGKSFAVGLEGQRPISFMLEKGKSLAIGEQLLYSSLHLSSVSLGYSTWGIDGQLQLSDDDEIAIFFSTQPQSVSVNGENIDFWFSEEEQLVSFLLSQGTHEVEIKITDSTLDAVASSYICNLEWTDENQAQTTLEIAQGRHCGSGKCENAGWFGRYAATVKYKTNDPDAYLVLAAGEQRLKHKASQSESGGCLKIGDLNFTPGDKLSVYTYGQLKLDWIGIQLLGPVFFGFEDNFAAWKKVNRVGELTFFRDEEIKHAGNYAAKVESKAGSARGWITNSWNLEGGKDYLVTIWCRTENVEKGATPRIKLFDASGKQLMVDSPYCDNTWGDMNFRTVAGTAGWQKIECPFTAPLETAVMQLDLMLSGKGKVWWDDLGIELVPPE